MKKVSEKFDVIVIGGGPAGMMAAGMAAKSGARVALFEKNNRLGAKLLMTGHGRCNVTNNIPDKEFIEKIGRNGKFLYSSLAAFNPSSMMDFLASSGLKLKTENKNRVFPASGRSADILEVLESQMQKYGVEIRLNSEVLKFHQIANKLTAVELVNNKIYEAGKFIVATGGQSYDATGSSGDGFVWAKKLGHRVISPKPGLTAMNLAERYNKHLEGMSLRNVKASILKDGKVVASGTDDLIFTATGVSGPLIHDLSLKLDDEKNYKISLDLFSEVSVDELSQKLQTSFHNEGSKLLKNGLLNLLEQRLVPVVLVEAKVDAHKTQNSVLREERQKLAMTMKNLTFNIESIAGFDKANVTVGGVDVREVDPKTMQSKLIENLYFAGEVLDLAGPTGGFNLQIAWSTGYAAGSN